MKKKATLYPPPHDKFGDEQDSNSLQQFRKCHGRVRTHGRKAKFETASLRTSGGRTTRLKTSQSPENRGVRRREEGGNGLKVRGRKNTMGGGGVAENRSRPRLRRSGFTSRRARVGERRK